MLDNVDPLFSGNQGDDAARLLKQVLSKCLHVRILSTCRTKLKLGGCESDFQVDPLDFRIAFDLFLRCIPDPDIQAQVRSLPPEHIQHVLKLVTVLQGHPLSIILAAHRIVAGPDPIVQQLVQSEKSVMGLLEAQELTGVPVRQRSLRASLNLSYNLLSERGREIFHKSSLLPGGLYRQVTTLDEVLGTTSARRLSHSTGERPRS